MRNIPKWARVHLVRVCWDQLSGIRYLTPVKVHTHFEFCCENKRSSRSICLGRKRSRENLDMTFLPLPLSLWPLVEQRLGGTFIFNSIICSHW